MVLDTVRYSGGATRGARAADDRERGVDRRKHPTTGGRHGLIALAVIAALGVVIAGVAIWRGADSDDLAAPDQRPAAVPHGLRSEAAPDSAHLIFTL